jgi:hypothetical protein
MHSAQNRWAGSVQNTTQLILGHLCHGAMVGMRVFGDRAVAEISKKWMGVVSGVVRKEAREWHFFAMWGLFGIFNDSPSGPL